ncbi:MAG: porphobilinogen synthase [Opitutaceae bacterium]|jgi:porphobilinogen synthase|nr:porphobilinogen synthase [Opitutaceae bacterium]
MKEETFRLNLASRGRRLRAGAGVRALVGETALRASDLVAPLFVTEGRESADPGPLPGLRPMSVVDLIKECRALAKLGVCGIMLFPRVETELKDEDGRAALDPDGLVLRAVRAVKAAVPGLVVMTDVALDPYTTHGHDGVLTPDRKDVDNDRTVEALARMAVLHAGAGADFVAPSDMMDGRVAAIRAALDAAGFGRTGILAYAAKFASAFYGPFREAVGSAPAAGKRAPDKRTYQLNPANRREALREVLEDLEEGADIVMVKPAGLCLDIIRDAREATLRPVAAYQVSGEYAAMVAAARAGWLDLDKARHESLLAIKRAGADMILTYFARETAEALAGK